MILSPRMLKAGMEVFAYPYGGYWIDVGTIDAFWEAHMDLLGKPPSLNLNDRSWISIRGVRSGLLLLSSRAP